MSETFPALQERHLCQPDLDALRPAFSTHKPRILILYGSLREVSYSCLLAHEAKLTFEVRDGVRPMQLFCANAPIAEDGALHVALTPRPASCKPRDRWLAEQAINEERCCGSSVDTKCCT
ncbi:UNVERIFIED_ORG: hypothetical protein J2W19_001343 [Shinella zoogloeoides]|nr:hypothetical protein [Shinella zoogloeoides]